MTEDYTSILLQRLRERVAEQPSVAPLVIERISNRQKCQRAAEASGTRNSYAVYQWAGVGLVAAAILAISFVLAGERTAFAFEEVQQALGKIRTLLATVEYPNQPHLNQRGFISAEHENARIEMAGLTVVMSPDGKSLMLNTEDGIAQRSSWNNEGAKSPADMLVRLTRIEAEAVINDGLVRVDGRQLIRFQVQWDPDDPELSSKLRSVVWVDPNTRLPVRSETIARDPTDKANGNKHWIISYQFNVAVPESHFSLEPPEGYRLVGSKDFRLPTSRLPNRSNSVAQGTLVLFPKKGIGNVRFGMVRQQVQNELGPADEVHWLRSRSAEEKAALAELHKTAASEEWDQTRRSRALEDLAEKFSDAPRDRWTLDYYSLGLSLSGSIDKGLTTIKCSSGKFGMYRPFPGSTAEGISLHSTPEEVRRVYGKPSREDRDSVAGEEAIYMVFESLEMTIEFRGGKVFEITL